MNLDTFEMHKYYMSRNTSLAATGKHFGIHGTSLRKRFIKANLPRKSRNATREVYIDDENLKHLYLVKNHSMEELSKILDCARGTIWNRICDLGINMSGAEKSSRNNNRTWWSEKFTNYVKGVLSETKSLIDTAKITGASVDTMGLKNKEWGIQVGCWSNKNTKKAKALLIEHMDYDKVAEILGVSVSSLKSKNYRDLRVDLSSNSNLFGIRTVGKDGRRYMSKLESYVANFLFDNQIAYEYEVRVCKSRLWTCDFKIGDLWLEVDGLGEYRKHTGFNNYSDKNEKIEYYKAEKFNYVVLGKFTWKTQLEELFSIS